MEFHGKNMKILKLKHSIFVFCALISIAVGTESIDEQQPVVNVGGKIFCVKPAETYCLHVVNYPRKEIELLLRSMQPEYNTDLPV